MESTPTPGQTPHYVPGYSEQERNRLVNQATILGPVSERFLRAAGLKAGMRVLDMGCGMGDVTILAAKIVGPTGYVLGLDRDAKSLEQAAARAKDGMSECRVEFVQSEFADFENSGGPFDAAIGRYVLLHQPDPAAILRLAASHVRADGEGIVAFHEFAAADLSVNAPTYSRLISLVAEFLRRGGAHADIGLRFTELFLKAGLPRPTVQAEMFVGGEAGSFLYPWIVHAVQVAGPGILKMGMATEDELDAEKVMARLEDESVRLGSQVIGPLQFGAWCRAPAS